ncbi:uncharacterized protein BO97DRAFT_423845 [Aspergillus homomorphus CBS 101889]|uniref:Uncharacterized protein n=1 Tax=Aspergillus homomorphus (strain CBS 101889) TaxID=1450537 RepID=A0A395I1V3_ASPHC|nr:hypothetical protein BO97DRAFT_423845 [Aspergillus homomorphus CBS 101889]RAL13148.1 hypothetical protein BO97DRAFT_423845 [Aspergillus homomorphus CBS 101889]
MPEPYVMHVSAANKDRDGDPRLTILRLAEDPRCMEDDWAPAKQAALDLWEDLRRLQPELRGQRMGTLLFYERGDRARFLIEPPAGQPLRFLEFDGIVEFVADLPAAIEKIQGAIDKWARCVLVEGDEEGGSLPELT